MKTERPRSVRTALGEGGRRAAPFLLSWGPVVLKIVAALAAAFVLAVIGARAGAHALAPAPTPAAPSALADAPDAAASLPAPAPPEAADAAKAPSAGTLPDGRVVLNLADEDALIGLPGIGPARARAILMLRQRLGKLRSVEQLSRVKGIGRKTLQRIRPRVLVDPPHAIVAEKDAG
jgi:competence ComEA-like helix-hairpin-helix protein